jgi:hypothetical protein
MARIRIEDLPPFEELTDEEKETTFGAGTRSFVPMFGSRESAALMDVAVAYALSPALLATAREYARERELGPEGRDSVNRMFRALARHALGLEAPPALAPESPPAELTAIRASNVRKAPTQAQRSMAAVPAPKPPVGQPFAIAGGPSDVQVVEHRAGSIFVRDLIHRGMNRWLFQEITAAFAGQQGDEITVTFDIDYGESGARPEKHKLATVSLAFAPSGWKANSQVYRFARAALSRYEGSCAEQLEERLREVFADGIGIPRFDPEGVAANAIAMLKHVLPGDYWLRDHEVVDGGVHVKLSVGATDEWLDEWQALEMRLDLKAADGGPEPSPLTFVCNGVELSASQGGKWLAVEGPLSLRDALQGVVIPLGAHDLTPQEPGPAQLAIGSYFAADEIEVEEE